MGVVGSDVVGPVAWESDVAPTAGTVPVGFGVVEAEGSGGGRAVTVGSTSAVPSGFGVVGAAGSSHCVVDGAEVGWGSFDAGLTCIEKRAPNTSRTKTAANHSARDTLPCIAEEARVFAANEDRPFPPFYKQTRETICLMVACNRCQMQGNPAVNPVTNVLSPWICCDVGRHRNSCSLPIHAEMTI